MKITSQSKRNKKFKRRATRNPALSGALGILALDLDGEDFNGLRRNVTHAHTSARLHRTDLIDHIHAADHATEYRIAPAVAGILGIQKVVVDRIDKPLAGGRVRFVCTSHSNRTALIQKAAAGFIDNGWVGGALLLEIRCKTAALNHEAVNDTMKNRTVIKPSSA